jgi:predicted DNA-binding protein
MRITIRLSREDGQKLDARADQQGMTISDMVRELIRNGYERQASSVALKEIMTAINDLAAHKEKHNNGEDMTEIKRILSAMDKRIAEQHRIITLLGQASPFVSSQLHQQ